MSKTSAQPPTKRVVVFIDEANVFEDAKRAFGLNDPQIPGRIKPMRYGMLLASRIPLGETGPRELKEVRVYTGIPSSSKDSKSYGAHRKQTASWTQAGAVVIGHALRYPREWPNARPEQKGVDVQIAIDIVVMAIRREYDVAILASADTDLRPALEACKSLPEGCPILEVAAWKGEGYASRLHLPGSHLWCHYLDRTDYLSVADRTRYA
jgi:uncharacterized LabA/DUF88 family protein